MQLRKSIRNLLFIFVWLLLIPIQGHANKSSYTTVHPLAWMHMLPTGETPGWTKSSWLNFEMSQSNIWNEEYSMTNLNNGKELTYEADFEQSTGILEFGAAISEDFAVSVEIPYALRSGGFLDDFIDQFHVIVGSERFSRQYNQMYDNDFYMKTDGENLFTTDHDSGVANGKLKFKYWPWKWQRSKNGACDCGLAFSLQVKVPTDGREHGLSSGGVDYSGLVHLGAPLGNESGIWLTAAYSYITPNKDLADWPIRQWQSMYEGTLDLTLWGGFGLIGTIRAESPLLNGSSVSFNYTSSTPLGRSLERIASGWNSLVHWRGTEAGGIRYRFQEGHQINLLIVEDWGIGPYDNRGDNLYVNNAPDVTFVLQTHWVF